MKELGLEDSQIGAMCGMTTDTVRHYRFPRRFFEVALKAPNDAVRW